MTLDAHEFIRRFLLHVLPEGFQRIRHYGFLANGHRKAKLVIIRSLFNAASAAPIADTPNDDTAAAGDTTPTPCPCCGASMRIIEVMPHPRYRRLRFDSS